jgi:hypothetical protein
MTDFYYGWPMLERVFSRAELMDRMMRRLGVNTVAAMRIAHGLAWYEARSNCIACCHDQHRLAWLDHANQGSSAPDFCLNARFFQECSEKQSLRPAK